jgi:hypothetical protein
MTIRKTLLSIIGLVFIAATAHAQLSKIVSDSIYQIPKTTVAPVIDGVIDNVWKTVDWNFQSTYVVDNDPTPPDDYTDLTGMTKALWDDENLYILFYSQDDDIEDHPTVTATWDKDAVEIYIDGDNSKIPDNTGCDPGGGRCPDDHQITIPHAFMGIEADTVDGLGLDASVDLTGIEFKIANVETEAGLAGWLVELKLPLENIGVPAVEGSEIGWDLQQDEADNDGVGDGARDDMSKWWSASNNSWTDASIWGTAVLSSRVVDEEYEIGKAPAGTVITIDGVMDPVYRAANPVTMNEYRVGDPPSGSAAEEPYNLLEDALLTAYVVWDDENIYYFMDIIDDDIQDNPTVAATWDKDAVEIYIDGDNSKVADNTGCDPGGGRCPDDHQITIPHAFMGIEADTVDGLGLDASVDLTGIEFKIVDKEEGGWYVEFKMPLENIGVPAVEGSEIGFELQLDESDGDNSGARGSMEKWWSASNNSWTDASIWGTARLGGEVVVGVKEKPSPVPAKFALSQNYPNPFNPSTKISFSITEPGLVTLKVFNLLGQEIATLVNEQLTTNTYEVDFNAGNLPSGVYLYRVTTGNSSITKKMMLLK